MTTLSLLDIHTCILGASRDSRHTEYAIQVRAGSRHAIVRRRYSAFVQLRQLILAHLASPCCFCGHDDACQLRGILRPVFAELEFDTLHILNTDHVVQQRISKLHFFLQRLHDALYKSPDAAIATSEARGCKAMTLLRSFFQVALVGADNAEPTQVSRRRCPWS
ncbi:Aste57867_18433 [Aphanomyces stellatus]|uniref:Aste57867_18433 protein n=1 Tax=Aphanomyces stellatus TaxID=120398 RepID=A0A485LAB7_9STRA|nr:hypothetical protein As57867_018371 [Aphanomyces stellatus]VFT95169.1 Aste57867_18433 [Aphanomyces stellatus]